MASPTTKLLAILRFVNIAPGASVQAHGLNRNGTKLVPDWGVAVTTGSITVSGDDTNVTVTNLGAGNINVDVFVVHEHSIPRVLGSNLLLAMVPQPFWIIAQPASGGGATGLQAFTYTAGAGDGSNFFIPLPAARADTNYIPKVSCGGVVSIVGIDCPDTPGDRLVGSFRVITSGAVTAGDKYDVVVVERT